MPIPLERLKNALLVEQARLNEQMASLSEVASRSAIGITNHQADDGTAAFDQAKDLAVRINAEGLLRQVNDALKRMEDGTYGLCLECGLSIDIARLKAIPYAELCMDCQTRREQRVSR
jgi:DnaK suppressor protein